MEEIRFYISKNVNIFPINKDFYFIKDIFHFYDLIKDLWSRETCAPRLKESWDKSNPSLGQCSITSFLLQDIFGGEVYGIKQENGNYHCYNVIKDIIVDITSEQFKQKNLDYSQGKLQSKYTHFLKEEKYQRYLSLKDSLTNFGGKKYEKS
jgi:hypothetical protein